MKRLILGIDTTFTNSTTKQSRLWAFVDSCYPFTDITNPFPIKDSISYTGLSSCKTNQTFVGCKLGDVNWDWNPAVARPIVDNRDAVELSYSYPSDALAGRTDGVPGRTDGVRIPVRVKDFKDMLGIQYTINFNPSVLKWVGIDNNLLNFETGTIHSDEGKVSFLWVDAKNEIKTLDDGSVIFDLVFEKTGKEAIENTLSVDGSVTSIAAYDKDYGLHGVVLNRVGNVQSLQAESWSIAPNPAKDFVNVWGSDIKEIIISDISGRIILSTSKTIIDVSNLTKGVYFINIQTNNNREVKKFIKL